MYRVCLLLLACCWLFLQPGALVPGATAQSRKAVGSDRLPEGLVRGQTKVDANAGTVTIMAQRILDGPIMRSVLDLSTLLDDGERFEKMRVLPIIARGKMQNLWDVIYLQGVDMGFVQVDILEYLKDDPQIDYIKSRVRYVTVMFPEELTLIARTDIKSVKDLAGKRVSLNAKGSGTNVTLPIVFRRLGIDAQFEAMDAAVALDRMRKGEVAAHVYSMARPARPIQQLNPEGLHILSIPFSEALLDYYLPSKFTSEDYPNLIQPGEQVDTIAVNQVLAVINVPESSERYRKIARFVDAFFTRFEELRKPIFSPQWKNVNLAAEVRGWTRFKAAQDWLDRHTQQRATFATYLEKSGRPESAAERERLFQEFLKWQRGQR